jgi:hypothetical protein
MTRKTFRGANVQTLFWLRVSYWAGALLDLIAGLIMIFPALFALNNRLSSFYPTLAYRYAMGMGAPLMLAWTILLLWADRKPLERRGILPITLLVILGEVVNEIAAAASGYISPAALIPTWSIQGVLTGLFFFSYWTTRKGMAE